MIRRLFGWWNGLDEDLRFRVERWVIAFGVAITILIGYFFFTIFNVNRYEYGGVPTIDLYTVFDHRIPLVPEAVWTYSFYYFLVLAPVFIARTRAQLLEMGLSYAIVSVVGWLFWYYVPVRMIYPELHCTSFSCRWLQGIYDADGGVNVFPSLHVAHSVLVASIYTTYRRRVPRVLLWAIYFMAVAVSVSTVLVKQHYLIDVPAGALLGYGAWWVTRRLVPRLVEFGARWGVPVESQGS